jgi:hypothetical protein
MQTVRLGLIVTPSTKDEYNRLFNGFVKCDFYAFNPPFRLEGEPGDHIFEETLKTHEKRYVESNVKSRYLLFDKSSHDRAQIFFQNLENLIGKERREQNIKIEHWVKSPEVPGYTFFLGYKAKKPVCIFYPSAVMQKGIPRVIIYIEGAEDFLNILKRHFLEKWDQATQAGGRKKLPKSKK